MVVDEASERARAGGCDDGTHARSTRDNRHKGGREKTNEKNI